MPVNVYMHVIYIYVFVCVYIVDNIYVYMDN